MTRSACVKYFNAETREAGEQFEFQTFQGITLGKIVTFQCANNVERIFNFDRVISITISST